MPYPNREGAFFEDGNTPLSESMLGTYKCEYFSASLNSYLDLIPTVNRRACYYISNENNNLKNNSLSEGDFINIRSETTIEKKVVKTKFSYLFTFLIELDPL